MAANGFMERILDGQWLVDRSGGIHSTPVRIENLPDRVGRFWWTRITMCKVQAICGHTPERQMARKHRTSRNCNICGARVLLMNVLNLSPDKWICAESLNFQYPWGVSQVQAAG